MLHAAQKHVRHYVGIGCVRTELLHAPMARHSLGSVNLKNHFIYCLFRLLCPKPSLTLQSDEKNVNTVTLGDVFKVQMALSCIIHQFTVVSCDAMYGVTIIQPLC